MFPVSDTLMKVKLALVDVVILGLALFLALWFRLGGSMASVYIEHFEPVVWPVVFFHLVAFFVLGIYRRLLEFNAFMDYALLAGGVLVGVAAVMAYGFLFPTNLPGSVIFIYGLLVFVFSGSMRFILRRLMDVDKDKR